MSRIGPTTGQTAFLVTQADFAAAGMTEGLLPLKMKDHLKERMKAWKVEEKKEREKKDEKKEPGNESTHSTSRSWQGRGRASQSRSWQGRGRGMLRVNTERRFLPRFKNRGFAPRTYKKGAGCRGAKV